MSVDLQHVDQLSPPRRLFDLGWEPRCVDLPSEGHDLALRNQMRPRNPGDIRTVDPGPGEDLLSLFEHVERPDDVPGLVAMFLSRVESRLTTPPLPGREARAERWLKARRRRTVSAEEVMSSPATIGLVKELFNDLLPRRPLRRPPRR